MLKNKTILDELSKESKESDNPPKFKEIPMPEVQPPKENDDPVNHPSHYTDGKIEVISFIEDKKLGFCLANAIKYISRAGKKESAGMTKAENVS